MSAYQGFTEPQDVIEARKARILGKSAPKADDNRTAKFAIPKGQLAIIFLVTSLVDVAIGMVLATITP